MRCARSDSPVCEREGDVWMRSSPRAGNCIVRWRRLREYLYSCIALPTMTSVNERSQKLNSVEFMTDFVHLYQSLPKLWRVESLQYSNKYKKEDTNEKMVMLAKTVYKESNVESVKSKINTIRGCFRKEMKKIMSSKRYVYFHINFITGASTEDIYVSKLWHYDLLSFTLYQEVPRKSSSNIPDGNEQSAALEPVGDDSESVQLPVEEERITTQDCPNIPPPQSRTRKRKKINSKSGTSKDTAKELLLEKANKALDRDEFDSYFENIAAKM
ncbi:hypothetical protein PR048_018578 [Dryococelus australis]|uniref:MADF domain-containing protein n=1 Tax=Dryococelus australis TaxID=614101 RepID=A0ABQ9HCM0_9NEOP|nr:hypothetical protein PR048_018578 [Dryococelus australis]